MEGGNEVGTSELLAARLLLVTGKGGVGKSSVAAALALAGSRTGRRTCLVEVERRQAMARLFGTQPWDFTEREFRPGFHGMSIDPEDSLMQYLEQFYGARRLSRLLAGTSAVEFVTTMAPGISDVLLIGKVKEMERRRDPDGRFHYDLIVVDAPPTGRIVNFLRAPEATTELVNMGPIRSQAQSVVDMLLDADAIGRLTTDAGLELEPVTVAQLQARGRRHLDRLGLQERMRERLSGRLQLPIIELPYLSGTSFGEAEVSALASHFEDHGA